MDSIYLDHAATTPVHPEVIDIMMTSFKETFGNPSSVHLYGRKSRKLLDEARRTVAKSINAHEKEIIFTSGGTEADNLAVIGSAIANQHKGKHIITTPIEHHATLHAVEYLADQGFEVSYLPVYEDGRVKSQDLHNLLKEDTILVTVMMVNNETGVIQPIQELAEIVKDHQTYFHSDIVQAYGLYEIDTQILPVDLLAVSSHKINGPKGTGFLYMREGTVVHAQQHGGEQERKRRAGTENVPSIAGFEKAVKIMENERLEKIEMFQRYRDIFVDTLESEQVKFSINGSEEMSAPSIINISFPGMNVETLLTNFDLSGIAASSGSACTAGSVEPSHVLSEMYGAEDERTTNSIRFSFGIANSEEQLVDAGKRISQIIKRLS
ncbi:cysteine desulfurase [Halobacillus andaensis]|uniref:cysteine desulfurase n=1 Tax=Halobacillus andaensis TaxID=1176239 RepID=A0A917AZ76_HALAA|nr:cysteine desulfurase family protein [Halobacillus andaensis]MBP2002993.1 cysteine desulfurase [Halobacillus andaensis]GGF07212.1 cysteine desulfurase [Halobacillus andaensis]